MISQGRDVASIAKSYGISELQVEKYLRLGKVHKTLFKLFKQDRLTLDQMMAFASTPDTKLQIATFKAIGEDCGVRPHSIREQLQNNRYSSDTALAKLVTLKAYQEAGGSVETDFFTDTLVFCDVEILVKLAEEKLLAAAAALKGWKWVETSMEGCYALHNYNRLPRTRRPVPKSSAAQLKKLTEELDKLDALNDEQWNDEHEQRYEVLETQIDELREKIDLECTAIAEKDKPYGGCIVTFNQHNGSIEIHQGLMTQEDVKAFQSKDKPKSDAQNATDSEQEQVTQIKAKPELSARLVADLGTYRRSIIKAELAGANAIAIDLLHFQVCLSVLGKGHASWSRILDMSFSTVNDESSIGDYKKTEAAMSLGACYAKLDTGWLSLKSEAKQFASFRELSSSKRQALVSYCVAQQLLSGGDKPGSDKLIDGIASELNIDFKKFWRPTDENYFSRLTKPLLLTLAKRLRGAAWQKAHTNDSKKALVESFQSLFHSKNESLTDKETSVRADWIPSEIDK